MSKLTELKIKSLLEPRPHSDGRGLYLRVQPSGAKGWLFRYSINGRRREIGLGTYPIVSLREARLKCDKRRGMIAKGLDPKVWSDRAKFENSRQAAMTFEIATFEHYKTKRQEWSNAIACIYFVLKTF